MTQSCKQNIKFDVSKLKESKRTYVMGILNVTPDSFSDGGKYFDLDAAVLHGQKMCKDGADIIDIGGESTKPYAKSVSLDEEIKRTIPVIEILSKKIPIPISIDTTKSEVATAAIEAGASIVNDISAMNADLKMVDIVKKYNVPVVLMHMQGTPQTMQDKPYYENVISEIKLYFLNAIKKAIENDIPKSNIIIDPGIGFGKTINDNFLLIKHLNEFKELEVPILIGTSRKSFIKNTLKNLINGENILEDNVVEIGTCASIAASVLNGADIVRVHNVKDTCITLKIIDSIRKV